MRSWQLSSIEPGWYISCNKARDGIPLYTETGPFKDKISAVRFAAEFCADRSGGHIWERKPDGSIEGDRGL